VRWDNTHVRVRVTIVIALLVLLGDALPRAQQPAFRAGTDLVPLSVTVTNAEHQYVSDLSREDFVVVEDGKPQTLSYFGRGDVPLAVALLIDSSASMLTTLSTAQDAAVGFVRELGPNDLAMLIDFDSKVQIRQGFTSEHAPLEEAIRRTVAGGSTMLNTAVYIALRELSRLNVGDEGVTGRRRAIVVLSDGDDTGSLVSFDDVVDLAERSNIVIYAIGLRADERFRSRRSIPGDFALRRFATQTGGRAVFPMTTRDIVDAYSDIRRELANQYVLAYESPPGQSRKWRNVSVRVSRPGTVARTRPGYYGR
jgi:Ca-activated chloride channel family protein